MFGCKSHLAVQGNTLGIRVGPVTVRGILGELADAQELGRVGWYTEFQRLHSAALVAAIAERLGACQPTVRRQSWIKHDLTCFTDLPQVHQK